MVSRQSAVAMGLAACILQRMRNQLFNVTVTTTSLAITVISVKSVHMVQTVIRVLAVRTGPVPAMDTAMMVSVEVDRVIVSKVMQRAANVKHVRLDMRGRFLPRAK
eukprot:Rmarinus@m.1451